MQICRLYKSAKDIFEISDFITKNYLFLVLSQLILSIFLNSGIRYKLVNLFIQSLVVEAVKPTFVARLK